jgi:N utilization substance protein A
MGALAPLIDESVTLEEDGRCHYVDANGSRCRNQARPGSRFCSVHAPARRNMEDDSLI